MNFIQEFNLFCKNISLVCDSGAISSVNFGVAGVYFEESDSKISIYSYLKENNNNNAAIDACIKMRSHDPDDRKIMHLMALVFGNGFKYQISDGKFKTTLKENSKLISPHAFFDVLFQLEKEIKAPTNYNRDLNLINFFVDFFNNKEMYPYDWAAEYERMKLRFIENSDIHTNENMIGLSIFNEPLIASHLFLCESANTFSDYDEFTKNSEIIHARWTKEIEKEKLTESLGDISYPNTKPSVKAL